MEPEDGLGITTMPRESSPVLVAVAGPNGAGKSTAGPALLRDTLSVKEYVNADVIAQGLSAFDPDRAALSAGRALLRRIDELSRRRVDFAFETTLAGRSYAPWISNLIGCGYQFHIVFLWLPDAEFAVCRVADRVRLGGHAVPKDVIRRRYAAGLRNFLGMYQPLASTWRMYDNSTGPIPILVAAGRGRAVERVFQPETWNLIRRRAGNGLAKNGRR